MDPLPIKWPCYACISYVFLSYREHLTCTTAKLKSRNNLITKLAGM